MVVNKYMGEMFRWSIAITEHPVIWGNKLDDLNCLVRQENLNL